MLREGGGRAWCCRKVCVGEGRFVQTDRANSCCFYEDSMHEGGRIEDSGVGAWGFLDMDG